MNTPTDPQGAEGRETRTETKWANIYRVQTKNGEWGEARLVFDSREEADEAKHIRVRRDAVFPRIAVERIETTTTITRHPLGGTERE